MRTVESVGATFVIARFPAIREPGSCPFAPFDPALSAASSHPRLRRQSGRASGRRRFQTSEGLLREAVGYRTNQEVRRRNDCARATSSFQALGPTLVVTFKDQHPID